MTQPILFDTQLFALITNVHYCIFLQDSALVNSPECMIQCKFKLLRSRSQAVTCIFVLSLISGELCQFTPKRICNIRNDEQNQETNVAKKPQSHSNIISELKVYRQNDIYDTNSVYLGACKTLFTLKIM